MPQRIPLGVEHDLGNVATGYLEKFKVIPAPNHPGEWALVGDLYVDEMPTSNQPLRGLSFAFTKVTEANHDEWEACVFLPFPHYNSASLNQHLLNSGLPLAIGRWHKKNADPETVGLIIKAGLFLLSPLWTNVFNAHVKPFLLGLFGTLSESEYDGLAFDYVQDVALEEGYQIKLVFVSDHRNWKASLDPELIRSGIAVAEKFLRKNPLATVKPVSQLRLVFSTDQAAYRPYIVQYQDGEHLTIG